MVWELKGVAVITAESEFFRQRKSENAHGSAIGFRIGPDSFRLRAEPGSAYILEAFLTGRWQDLYAFTLDPFELVDYEPFNYWNSTSPHVRWTRQKVCTIPTKDGRIVAVDREFKIHGRGNRQTILAKSHEEYLQLLRDYFGLEITGASIK